MPSAADCAQAYSELHRVADYVFVCLPPKSSILAWLSPAHHLWVKEVEEGTLEIEERQGGARYFADPSGNLWT